jgi:vacuolar-type H+-ATPase subunit E/Vma4
VLGHREHEQAQQSAWKNRAALDQQPIDQAVVYDDTSVRERVEHGLEEVVQVVPPPVRRVRQDLDSDPARESSHALP